MWTGVQVPSPPQLNKKINYAYSRNNISSNCYFLACYLDYHAAESYLQEKIDLLNKQLNK